MTLDEFAHVLELSARAVHPRLERDLYKIGALQEALAAEYIGREMPTWPPLAPSTISDKEKHGYPVPAPLLRTGAMRDSIRSEVEPLELELAVGSTDPVALWQELGTRRGIPPRPFLGLAAGNSLEYAADKLGETMLELLTPGDVL
jgi:hypothetical protein